MAGTRKALPRKAHAAKKQSCAKVKVEKSASSRKSTTTGSSSKRKDQSGAANATPVRPTPAECYYATTSLAVLHPHVVEKNDERRATLLESCGLRDSITDSIVGTMLSQNTTDKNSKQAFANLKKTFSSWSDVCDCDDLGKIEKSIKVAGLAKTRAERIRALLRTVKEERGTPSLDYLRDMADDEVKEELSRFKGLGPKTISCVLLFAMGRSEFPVDTHVLRIARDRLNWLPSSATRESAYEHLNAMVPAEMKLDLHCLLVTHGKHCHACAAGGKPQFPPKDGSKLSCPLSKERVKAGLEIQAEPLPNQNVKTEMASPDCVTSQVLPVLATSYTRSCKAEAIQMEVEEDVKVKMEEESNYR